MAIEATQKRKKRVGNIYQCASLILKSSQGSLHQTDSNYIPQNLVTKPNKENL